MDCNKEEAIRAKGLAEKQMENRDFVSAQKFAVKAQKLYPDLENISQMLLVCDVLCSSEKKVYGNEKDWYAILNIGSAADEASIRKQYRKFALSLHPDKNKFCGASDAFKLISEAQKVLLDREKRLVYDTKLRAAGSTKQQTGMKSNVERQPRCQNNFRNNVAPQFSTQQQQQFVNNCSTFWTVCPFCSVRYQFYKEIINKMLVCQNCKKHYTAYEMNNPGSTSTTNRSHAGFPKQKEAPRQNNSKVGPQGVGKSYSKMATQENVGPEKHSDLKTRFTSMDGEGFVPRKESVKSRSKASRLSGQSNSRNNKKRKRVIESSESCDSLSISDTEEDTFFEDADVVPNSSGCNSELHPRRSSRLKKHVSYDDRSFDGIAEEVGVCGIKKEASCYVDGEENETKARGHHGSAFEENAQNGGKDAEKRCPKADFPEVDMNTSSLPSELQPSSTNPEVYEYPDPEFSDFEKDRKKENFAKGQIWAVYDTLDAMPRFYALISKIYSPGFRVQITWLEPDPDDQEEIEWVEAGLPASCGKFRNGQRENTEDLPMFSHLIYWEKGSRRGTYKIYPRKGETWALFKDWDLNWHSDHEAKKKFAYEFVEVLSDYADGVGVHVVFLDKVKNFACLFCRRTKKGMPSVSIPAKEVFRFSHKVPSFQMTGKEREDVPEESFELDPASLPFSTDGSAILEEFHVAAEGINTCGSGSTSVGSMVEPKAKSEKTATQIKMGEAKATVVGDASTACFLKRKEKSRGNASANDIVKQKLKSSENFSSAEPKTMSAGSASPVDMMQPMKKSEGNSTPGQADEFEVPEPEFYNFDQEKSPNKFQIGQIWAMYSNEDALPKYYGMIKGIDQFPAFQLHVSWLDACASPKSMINWLEKDMLTSCGRFRLTKGKSHTYIGTDSFSHLSRAEHTDTKDIYAIFPRKGEVWALYRNWNAGMRLPDLVNCKYDIVEVVEENISCITVLVLELVDGFKSVFRPQMASQSTITMQISSNELLRFSHRIPAFRLTEEKGGSLRGFWELDTAAMPIDFWHQ